MNGDYDARAEVGKKLVKKMTDEQKLYLIDLGAHIAHEGDGNLMPDKAYKIEFKNIKNLNDDGSNFFDYAKEVKQ